MKPGQRYCSICGSFLLHPEQGDTFCPQCGVRVSSKQEFCHECDAPLKGEAAAALKAPPPEAPAAAAPERPAAAAAGGKMQPWVLGLLIGAGLVIIILLILLFSRGTSTPPEPKAEAPAATGSGAPAPAPAPAAGPHRPDASCRPAGQPPRKPPRRLKSNWPTALSTLREAQLNKDIVKFMSVYSLTFPELDQKRADTLAVLGELRLHQSGIHHRQGPTHRSG